MLHVTVNFIRPRAENGASGFPAFVESTWLIENAEHLRTIHPRSSERLHILLVGQIDQIPPEVLESMDSTCIVHDASDAYQALVKEFPTIVGHFGGPYSVFGFAFLRWLLVQRVFGGEPVLCYDGDVIHNVPLAELAGAFAGITRTATSTCFAAISDPEWFNAWRRNLSYLESDTSGFLERYLPTLSYGFDQFVSTPEEYFAKFLIEAGELPQQDLPPSFPLWVIPQPQTLPRLFNFVRSPGSEYIPTPMRYARVAGIDMINDRPVAFWHMQKPFMSQLSALAMMSQHSKLARPDVIPPLVFYGARPSAAYYLMNDPYHHLGGTPTVPWRLQGFSDWLIRQMHAVRSRAVAPAANPFSSTFLYNCYFRNGDFSPLFNNARWAVPRVWEE